MITDTVMETVEESEDITEIRDAARELRDELERVQGEVEELEKQIEESESNSGDRKTAIDHIPTRYPRLLTGDLSKLNWTDRMDLFRAVSDLGFSAQQGSDAERTMANLDGMLR